MPVSLLNTDTSFPSFQQETPVRERVEVLTDYLYMLLEELRYTFGNLGAENFNDKGLEDIGKIITKPLLVKVENINEVEKVVAELTVDVGENTASISAITQWQNETEQSIASLGQTASQNEAKITALTKWQTETDGDLEGLRETMAILELDTNANSTSISQIVKAVGSDDKVTAASIVAAVNKAGSSVKISADHIDITGFVTFSSLETDGATTINGNNVSLILDGSRDNGYTNLDSINSFTFKYRDNRGVESPMAKIYTEISGDDTYNTSRYALKLRTEAFYNNLGNPVYPAIKLLSAGRISIESMLGIYIGTEKYDGSYITLDAYETTRIATYKSFRDTDEQTGKNKGYCFCTDGIYYNGTKIIST